MSQNQATAATRGAIDAFAQDLPMGDTQDFEDAERGFVARSDVRQIRNTEGRVVWDLDAYRFLDGPTPDTANPSLWRQSQLLIKDGLFEVVSGIYQLRGYDLSVMSVIEGVTGVIVIDPLISQETATAALELYREHRGRSARASFTPTHTSTISADPWASRRQGVSGDRAGRAAGHAVAENVYAGTAMARRAAYMYGAALPRGPKGSVGAGLGQTTSLGTVTLITPTVDISHTGQELTVDGVRIIFQVTPGTEAPAEMNFYFPDHRALCMAENATHTLHNLLTLRGALVRDPHIWATYLTEAINLHARDSDVVFASHHWPTWGTDRIVEYLSLQRDLYAYLHDQTLRQINQGKVGAEVAEDVPAAARHRKCLAHTRILRFRQPQCESDLPALPGLVRRQPRTSLATPAGGIRHPPCRIHGRSGRGPAQGP